KFEFIAIALITLLVIMADITKAKELEHLLRMQDKMASLGRVAAGIAHEIRNPLSGINMYLSALTAEPPEADSPQRREMILGKIAAASAKIEAIIKRVQDFARPGARELSWLNINQVVTSACELSAVTLRKSGIDLETSLAQGLPACHADRQLLEQVLLNLITNAVQALADWQGDKRIAVSSALAEDRVVIQVADSGPGVAPEIRDRIFDPFFTTKKDGSGIGLSICHRIISDHGGSLSVNTSQWGGALFTIRIPTTTYWGYDSHG
ncbi:MAG: sensor histidine kinase, partial [Anaerolineae bacterium]